MSSKHSPHLFEPSSAGKILLAFLLNLGFSIFEFIGGTLTGSISISSDAVHDLGDCVSIGVAYFLEKYSQKQPNDRYTFGYLRYSVLGGLITTVVLLVGSTFVIASSISRFSHPVAIQYSGTIGFAIVGVIVNFAAAYFTHGDHSTNQKSVNLHMLEDVLGWVVVLIGAIIMRFTNFSLIDPILSILVALFILVSALKNFKTILDLFLEKTPQNLPLEKIKSDLLALPGVDDVHHIHLWSMDGIHNYATLHVVSQHPSTKLKSSVRELLEHHDIGHATIELERPDEHCSSPHCVVKPQPSSHHH